MQHLLVGLSCVVLLYFALFRCVQRHGWKFGMVLFAATVAGLATVATFQLNVLNPIRFQPVDLTDRVVLITGATAGIGKESARKFAEWNATVVVLARNIEKAARVKSEIEASLPATSTGSVEVRQCDLASFATIRHFASDFLAGKTPQIDVLMLNAGMAGCDECDMVKTKDGVEAVMQTNYLGHFLLTELLMPALRQRASQVGEARIVHVSSRAHYVGELSRAAIEAGNSDPSTARLGSLAYFDGELMQVRACVQAGVCTFACAYLAYQWHRPCLLARCLLHTDRRSNPKLQARAVHLCCMQTSRVLLHRRPVSSQQLFSCR